MNQTFKASMCAILCACFIYCINYVCCNVFNEALIYADIMLVGGVCGLICRAREVSKK